MRPGGGDARPVRDKGWGSYRDDVLRALMDLKTVSVLFEITLDALLLQIGEQFHLRLNALQCLGSAAGLLEGVRRLLFKPCEDVFLGWPRNSAHPLKPPT